MSLHSPPSVTNRECGYWVTVNFAEGDNVFPVTRSRMRITSSYLPVASLLESINRVSVRRCPESLISRQSSTCLPSSLPLLSSVYSTSTAGRSVV